MLFICRRQVLKEQQQSSFASDGCAKIDKPGQRTCLPRRSVRKHTSTFAHLPFPFFQLTCAFRFPSCLRSQFCSSLSCASVSDHDHCDWTRSLCMGQKNNSLEKITQRWNLIRNHFRRDGRWLMDHNSSHIKTRTIWPEVSSSMSSCASS